MELGNRINNKSIYGYGLGNLGYGMILQAMTTYLIFFGTSLLKLPSSVLGVIISTSVIWDAISDPIMGTISDYTRSKRYGRRNLYILIGSAGIAICNAGIWSISEDWSMSAKLIAMIFGVYGVKTFATIFITPYMALGSELSDDYYQRTTIQSVRTIFFVLGMAFTVVVGMTYFLKSTAEFPVGQMNRAGYMYLGFTVSIITVITGIMTHISTKKHIPRLIASISVTHSEKNKNLGKQLKGDIKELLKNRNYLFLALAYLSTNIASAIIGSIGLHVFTYTFRFSSMTIGIVLGTLFLFNILCQPFWIRYAKKHDKRNAAVLATQLGLVSCLIFVIAVVFKQQIIEIPYLLLPFSALAGVSVGGLLTLPLSMIGDTIDLEEYHTGKRSEGLYYGGLTFSYKGSQAIAIAIVGVLLDFSGFDAHSTVQLASTEFALGLILAVGSLMAFLLTLYAYKHYNLSHEDIVNVRNKMKEKQNL